MRPPTLLAAVLATLLVACSTGRVPLSELASHQDRYTGHRLTTWGTVAEIEDPSGFTYLVVEDSNHDRVLLQPATAVEARLGETVEITGRFEVDPNRGRTLTVSHVQPVPNG